MEVVREIEKEDVLEDIVDQEYQTVGLVVDILDLVDYKKVVSEGDVVQTLDRAGILEQVGYIQDYREHEDRMDTEVVAVVKAVSEENLDDQGFVDDDFQMENYYAFP